MDSQLEPPRRRPPPRDRLSGGFVMGPQTAIEWANRIVSTSVPHAFKRSEMTLVWQVIRNRIIRSGVLFSCVGEIEDAEYMVVTQRKSFNGYLGMDVSLIPQFEEGEREAHVRKLLEAEGVTDIEFATRLD